MKRSFDTCPKCGENNTECINAEWSLNTLCQNMSCKCGCTWKEYYTLQYIGYVDETGSYDANGVKED